MHWLLTNGIPTLAVPIKVLLPDLLPDLWWPLWALGPLWGGLWVFAESADAAAVQSALALRGLDAELHPLPPFRHTFSHFHLEIEPWLVRVKRSSALAVAENNWLWYNPYNPPRLGLAAPIKELIERTLIQSPAGDHQ